MSYLERAKQKEDLTGYTDYEITTALHARYKDETSTDTPFEDFAGEAGLQLETIPLELPPVETTRLEQPDPVEPIAKQAPIVPTEPTPPIDIPPRQQAAVEIQQPLQASSGMDLPVQQQPIEQPPPQADAQQRQLDPMGTVLGKSLENVPGRFARQIGGGMEYLGTGPDVKAHPIQYTWFDNLRGLLSRTGLGEKGQEIFDDATKKIEANAPNVEPGSLEYYSGAILASMAEMGPSLAFTFITKQPIVGGSIMGSQVFGDKYAEQKRKGRTDEESAQDALFYAATEGISEAIPLGVLTREGGKILARTMKASAAEALQEVFNNAAQIGYEMRVLDENISAKEGLRRLWDAAIIGAGAGGGLAVITQPLISRKGQDPQEQQPGDPGEPILQPEAEPTPDEIQAGRQAETAADLEEFMADDRSAEDIIAERRVKEKAEEATAQAEEQAQQELEAATIAEEDAAAEQAIRFQQEFEQAQEQQQQQEEVARTEEFARAEQIEQVQQEEALEHRIRQDQAAEGQPTAMQLAMEKAKGTGEQAAPVKVETVEDVERASEQVDTTPSEAEKEAGNYKLAHVNMYGMHISIENPKGSIRSGTDADGKKWETVMPATYGYIRGTVGADSKRGAKPHEIEQVDVYIGDNPDSKAVFMVDQIDPKTGNFDEHKVILASNTQAEAEALYDAGFSDGSGMSRRGAVTAMSVAQFKQWLKNGNTKKAFRYEKPKAEDKTKTISKLRKGPSRSVDPKKDDLLSAIAKLGGINRKEAGAQGIDKADFNRRGHRIFRVFTKNGRSFDEIAQTLQEQGYPVTDEQGNYDPNVLLDRITDAMAGKKVLTNQGLEVAVEQESRYEDEHQDELNALADITEDMDQSVKDMSVEFHEATSILGEERVESIAERVSMQSEDLSAEQYEQALIKAFQEAVDVHGKQQNQDDPDSEEGYQGRPAGQKSRQPEERPGFALAHQEVVPPTPTPVSSTQGDMFGGKSETAQVIKDREVARQKKERDAPPMESGEGDLFSGKSKQTDIEDLVKKKVAKSSIREDIVKYEISPQTRDDINESGPTRRDVQSSTPIQTDLFVKEGTDKKQAKEKAEVTFGSRVKEVQVGTFNIGLDRIDTDEQAAHVFAPLRKSNVEQFLVLTLDKDRRPISILKQGYGTIDGASVFPKDVLGAIHTTPGTQSVWIGHNHPAGDPTPSQADRDITKKIHDLMKGTGVEFMGSIIVAPGGKSAAIYGPESKGVTPTPKPRKETVPITEGRLRKIGKLSEKAFTSPEESKNLLPKLSNGASGILFLDNKHRPVAYYPVEEKELKKLRTGKVGTGASKLFQVIRTANAAAMIGYFPDANMLSDGVRNLVAFSEQSDTRLLDVINSEGSQAERGALIGHGKKYYSLGKTTKPFYSALTKAIEDVKQPSAPPAQWKAVINKLGQKGIKKEEIEWSGVMEWISDQKGKVTREQMVDYLRANEVQVEELEKDDIPFTTGSISDKYKTKFAQYQLPGGENYRELLLTLPEKQRTKELPDSYGIRKNDNGSYTVYSKHLNDPVVTRLTRSEALSDAESYLLEQGGVDDRSQAFKSSHYSEPNILAHVRFNERTDVDGKRVLFIEESQSDWHAEGRKKGYKGDIDRPAEKARDKYLAELNAKYEIIGDNSFLQKLRERLTQQEVDKLTELNTAFREEGMPGNEVPDAPFKTTWPLLAFKRMIRYAAENGFDKLAFTTGEQQADRYDLSHQVERVKAFRRKDGAYDFMVTPKGETTHKDIDGVQENKLADTVGKELADKIIKQPNGWQTYDGLDLKVGGKGMKTFYDKMLPSMINKYVKKWGGKVGETKLKATLKLDESVVGEGDFPYKIVNTESGRTVNETRTRDSAEAEKKEGEHIEVDQDLIDSRMKSVSVHSIDITPEMSKAAMAGQPLFARGRFTEDYAKHHEAVVSGVKDLIRDMAPSVNVEVVDQLFAEGGAVKLSGAKTTERQEAAGVYDPAQNLIQVSLGLGDPQNTAQHEALHALKDMGLITGREWRMLSNRSKSEWMSTYEVQDVEEGIAYAFGDWRGGKTFTKPIQKLFQRIKTFFERLGNLLRGMGFKTVDDVFESVKSGEVGKREGKPSGSTEIKASLGKSEQEYTEEQQAAIDVGGFGKQHKKSAGEKFDEARYRVGSKLRQGIVDQFDSFASVLKDNRSWMMAHLTHSTTGALEAIIQFGRPSLKENVITVDTNQKSLQEIFLPLDVELNRWLQWVAGNRAERLKVEGKERLFSEENIAALKSLNEGNMKDGRNRVEVYESVRKEFEAMNDAVVGIAVETGLIGAAERAMWKDQGFYLPFYRMLEDDSGKARGPKSFGGGLVRQTAYKELKGADLQLDDLLSNVMLNWHHLLGASLKNQAAAHALMTAEAEGMGLAKQVAEHKKGKDAVFIRKGGKKVWYDISDGQDGALVLDSLLSLNWDGLNTTSMKILRKFKRALTIGVTVSPSFKIRNLLRDSVQAIAVADMSTQIYKNLYQGWKATKKKNPVYATMMAGGGIFTDSGYIHGADPDAIRYLVDKGVKRGTILDSRYRVKKLWDAYQDFGGRLENINRAANFEQALTKKKDLLEANFEARDHLDFSRTGSFTAVRAIAQTVPFVNARLQGMDKLGRAGMSKDQRKQFVAVVGTYAIAGVLLYLHMKDDDDYKAAEEWERDAYHLFKIPGSDVMYRFPRPFEVGAIASVMERLAEQVVDDDVHGILFAERLYHTLKETLSFNLIPQAFQPALEVYANKNSFTGRQIESESMKGLSAVERKRAWTSETAIWFSGRMDDVSWGKVVLSPVQIEHLVKGYLGWAGATVLGGVDLMVTRPLTDAPSRPALNPLDYPVIRDFARVSPSRNTKQTTLFYENLIGLNKTYADIRNARRLGNFEKEDRLYDKAEDKLSWRKSYLRTRKYLSNLNVEITDIMLDKEMAPYKKRQLIDKLIAEKNEETRWIVKESKKDFR